MKKIIIHEGGRVKPLDTYARNILLIFNGKSTFSKMEAIDWLARVMFSPERTLEDRIFKVNHKDILYALGLMPHESNRYSYNELIRSSSKLIQVANLAFSKEANDRSSAEKEFIRIYQNFALYNSIMNNFIFALPVVNFNLPDQEVKKNLKLPIDKEYFSYLDIMEKSQFIRARVKEIKQKDKGNWFAQDVFIWELDKKYNSFLSEFQTSSFFFLPSYVSGKEKWFNFMQVLNVSQGDNIVFKEIKNIKQMVEAYRSGDQEEFDLNVNEYINNINAKIINQSLIGKSDVEIFYNRLDPFYRSMIFYGIAFIALFIFIGNKNKWIWRLGLLSIIIGALFHLSGLIIRMIITERPPVTNLFETFIFVGMVAVLIALLLEWFARDGVGILVGAFSGLVLLLISNKFSVEGDTMAVLVAVLRSNFWLSTHVVTISLGYSGIVISGVIGHIYLFYRLKNTFKSGLYLSKNKVKIKKKIKNISKMIYATQAFGLVFTFIGTVLGGVWADQSWGRFWGWDPKENGSLLIVLWSALIFHARMGGMIRELGFATGSMLGIVVVTLAWFGINLLGVGLHSYGFTSGIAQGLYSYIGVQFILIFSSLTIIEYRKQKFNQQ